MTITQPNTPDAPAPSALTLPVSVLELGARLLEVDGPQALQDVVEVARTAERYGYERVWVAEHHSSLMTASGFPAVMIAHIAARTERIRVGSGGVMLPNYAPFVVAEQFATLQALYPGRIDLGLGRSPGGTGATQGLLEAALRRDPRAGAEFADRIDELMDFLHHRAPEGSRFHALPLTPRTATPPDVYVLGAGENSARIAAERGLPFAYGYHQGSSKCRPEAVERYRSAFRPGPQGARPYVVVAVNVVCAETDEEAEAAALETSAYMALHPEKNPSAAALSPVRREYLAHRALEENQVVRGAPPRVAAGLARLADELGADELMILPYELSGAARSRTLRLTAGIRAAQARRRHTGPGADASRPGR
ncbi:MsnO8 family LLM class oxidoreductase [Actinacidiphila acididurans]|uniref:MsnO8 family LLM class oxidoreductase n=1 Tax=Actinacidiphila acididurans TaxID=2784346 RepID=A0ABS2TZW7_9ACTN|nr:MsnO8 family LLM class oxidoreductase [Actinacidiphila acididurans]MBM9508893.1 MsnO8 family LLM class oxidoreductase [Actinacidiphila acididurans]